MTELIHGFLLSLAFAMGFLVPRGTTCAVAAVTEIMDKRQGWRFGGFAIASLAATSILLPVLWLQLLPVTLAPDIKLTVLVCLGGLVFGLGAGVNGACVFGTASKLFSGQISYLFILPGLWLGAFLILSLKLPVAAQRLGPSWLSAFSISGLVVWVIALLLLAAAFYVFARNKLGGKALIMAGIGLCGGLIYAVHPHWNYGAAIDDLAKEIVMVPGQMPDGLLPWLVLSACIGGVISTVTAGTFKFCWPKVRASFGSLVGGVLMAFGTVMIPGGNDGLVLSILPSMLGAGLVAYASMCLGIVMAISLGRRVDTWRRGRLAEAV